MANVRRTLILLFICSYVGYVTNGHVKSKKKHGAGYNTSELLDQLLRNYDKRLRPGFGAFNISAKTSLMVDVNLNIRSMGPISEMDMAYQMDCYFRQSWVDKRLEFNGTMKKLTVAINLLDRIWKPDTHFLNGKRSYLHTVTSPNKLLRINQDGRILYSMRLTIKASCPMHLEKFPMDTQSCPLRFGSHGYVSDEIQYKWTHGGKESIKMAPDMRLSQFDLIGSPAGNTNVSHAGGHFTVLYVNFVLKRHTGYFLINVYVPCSLLVVLSWVAFYINREATADRIALGVTTVLTMAFLGIENRTDLPKVSYSTAIDYYVGVCFAFVLATIIQFAGVHFFTKHGSGEHQPDSDSEGEEETDLNASTLDQRRTLSSQFSTSSRLMDKSVNGSTSLTSHTLYPSGTRRAHRHENCCQKFYQCIRGSTKYREMKLKTSASPDGVNSVSKIDTSSRVLFPLFFIIFNIFYWCSYLDDTSDKQLLVI